jgi:hypothetical protein
MRFGVNLRGDLAKLDDAEIASRFEALIAETEAKHRTTLVHAGGEIPYRVWKACLVRGPFHARIFYKIQAFLFYGWAAIVGGMPGSEDFDLYLLDCELKDVRDEIKHRVRLRKTAVATT